MTRLFSTLYLSCSACSCLFAYILLQFKFQLDDLDISVLAASLFLILKVLFWGVFLRKIWYMDRASLPNFPPPTPNLSLYRWYRPQFQNVIIHDLLVTTERREHWHLTHVIVVHPLPSDLSPSSSNLHIGVIMSKNPALPTSPCNSPTIPSLLPMEPVFPRPLLQPATMESSPTIPSIPTGYIREN